MDEFKHIEFVVKCKGTKCPIKNKCYRYTVKETENTEWLGIVPFQMFDGGKTFSCGFFWGENANDVFNKLYSIIVGRKSEK